MRHLVRTITLAVLCAALSSLVLANTPTGKYAPKTPNAPKRGKLMFYVGSYTKGKAEGIYYYELNTTTGAMTRKAATVSESPSFLALGPDGKHLFAVNETGEFNGQPGGGVSAYAVNPATGGLTFLNSQLAHGTYPCHIITDPKGKHVLIANYGSGNVTSYGVGTDGKLTPVISNMQHSGKGPDAGRQEGPHAHCINLDPSGKFALSADLGTDKVVIYKLDAATGALTPSGFGQVAPGSGPRHLTFSPNGKFVYVINELNSTMTGFSWDGSAGSLTEIEAVSTLPEGFTGTNYPAEVVVHPTGKFLYGSNRGHNSLVCFALDAETGKMTQVGHTMLPGKNPRSFAIDPSGQFLLAAHQDTDTIVSYLIDPNTGKLTPTGHSVSVSKPVHILFVTK